MVSMVVLPKIFGEKQMGTVLSQGSKPTKMWSYPFELRKKVERFG
jgi:hypothetical protein